jgi:nitroimidazol reductase NimA-like FMN-containing flavoprotein (pyridoxamine 5'-phosphate oxidase superfamily)
VTRLRELQVADRGALDAVLDEVRVAHVGLTVDDHPVVVPTAVARRGDAILVHGSTGSGWMRAAAGGAPVCVAVTAFDGLVVARSVFESSFRYRSALLFGRFEALEVDAKAEALEVVVDKLLPGRSHEVRPSTSAEIRRTMVLSLPIGEWSLKVSDGWPDDGEDDVAGPAWAGVIPFALRPGPPVPTPGLRPGIPVPSSVTAVVEG